MTSYRFKTPIAATAGTAAPAYRPQDCPLCASTPSVHLGLGFAKRLAGIAMSATNADVWPLSPSKGSSG